MAAVPACLLDAPPDFELFDGQDLLDDLLDS